MDTLKKFAAIDIGSNAIRLLLAGVFEDETGSCFQKKISWMRMPIRLGEDAFIQGAISDQKISKFEKTMAGFKMIIDAFEPIDTMACATSAMRAASNGEIICDSIYEQTGIRVNIIDGTREADIIFQKRPITVVSDNSAALMIDVGGGSTEITVFFRGRSVQSQSFNIGTIRLLKNMVDDSVIQEMKNWIKKYTSGYSSIEAFGSGGNISKLFRLANGKPGSPVAYRKIYNINKTLNDLSVEQRIRQLNLRPDRADVIGHGSWIYLQAMKWAGCKKMHVPLFGLADGMVRVLNERHKAQDV